jgi:hypothetical protein
VVRMTRRQFSGRGWLAVIEPLLKGGEKGMMMPATVLDVKLGLRAMLLSRYGRLNNYWYCTPLHEVGKDGVWCRNN